MRARAGHGRLIALGGAATMVVVAVLPTAAQAAPSDKKFDVAKNGKVVAGGAAVKVKFTYNCPKGWQGGAGVTLVEALGDTFASGYGGKNLKCSGEPQEATFFVQANTYEGAHPFRAGDASIVANLDAWNPQDNGCGEGAPCPMPVEGDAPAAAPGGKSAVPSMSATPVKEPASLHREFSGVVTLG